MMTWCNEDDVAAATRITVSSTSHKNPSYDQMIVTCPSCGHQFELYDQSRIHDLPGLPAGVKFDPTDQEILEHLEAKVIMEDVIKPHPLIDEFIPTLEGDNGICYTHPEKLPGVSKDGQVRHFFHRPSKAYTTGTRKRRKVHSGHENGTETRWHKTGKTRPIFGGRQIKGFKKILVLYTNYGRQRKPEKTNWVMHQYHLGSNEEEKDGELVVSKVFYQTQPRQCGSSSNKDDLVDEKLLEANVSHHVQSFNASAAEKLLVQYDYDDSIINPNHYDIYYGHNGRGLIGECPPQLIPHFIDHHSRDETHERLIGN